MTTPISKLSELLRSMQPLPRPGVYVYAALPPGADWRALEPDAAVREPEGMTVVLEEQRALAAGLQVLFRASWITLHVHSDLQAVGLTAAFAAALGAANISCNVIAGAYHDHILVPVEAGAQALAVLQALQQSALAQPATTMQ